MTGLKKLLMWKASGGAGPVTPLVEATASGNPATFVTDVARPLKACTVSFSPVQEGSGDPSPENVRPIAGWTGAKVYRTGKNLFDVTTPISRSQYVNGTLEPLNNARIMTDYIPVKYGATYTMSIDPTTDNLAFINYNLFDENKNWLCDRVGNGESESFSGHTEHSFTVNYSGASYIRIVVRDKTSSSTLIDNKTLANSYLQLEPGSTATPYEPYTGQTVDVQFPSEAGTVYGGTIDLVSGLLTVTYKAIVLNADTPCDSFKTQNSGKYTIWTGVTGMASGTFASDDCVMVDKAVKVAISGDVGNDTLGILIGFNNSAIYLYNMSTACGCTTTEQISEWLAQNPITCTIPLATPITYQVSRKSIRTLIGTNNVRSDANGTLELTYLKKA